MKDFLTPRRSLAVAILLGATASAGAQSLGAPRAELFIGRPLELTVPARLGGPDGREDCVHADVSYGDTRLPAGKVRTRITGPRDDRRVHVESDLPVDEPVVTVALRAGCSNTVTRSYTLLPDAPSEIVLAASAARAAGAVGAPAAPPKAQRTAQRSQPRPLALKPVAERAPREAAPRVRVAKAQRPPDEARKPRLRLEMWEPEPQALLRVSSHLTEPTQDLAHRAGAALLWRAINADPQELLRTSANLQKLETDLAQLRATANQTRAEMAFLRQRLEAPRTTGLAQAVQLLLVLLLAAASGAAYYWFRSSRNTRAATWYEPHREAPLPAALPEVSAPAAFFQAQPEAMPVASVPVPAQAAVAEPEPLAFEPPETPDDLHPAQRRTLRVEALAATFEEVEFLSSLGLWDDAKDALKTYLEDSTAPAPLAFFELMRLCVHTDDASALAAVRRRYLQVFGAEAPKFELLTAPLGLESQPELSTRITRAWGRPEAVDLIEQSLFTVPPPGKVLSLQAGRDLISLASLAGALADDAQAARASEEHELAPWVHGDASGQAIANAQADDGNGVALDLDLSVQVPPQAAAPEPEAQQLQEDVDLELEPLLAEFEAAVARDEASARKEAEEVDAFSAAVAAEPLRRPQVRQ